MKKILFVIVFVLISLCVFAQEKDFDIIDGVLLKYNGIGKNIAVPNGVKSIGEEAFAGAETLISVTLPKGLISIGYGAFSDCINLEKITLPGGLKEINESAFFNNRNLKEINIPASVEKIGDCIVVKLG